MISQPEFFDIFGIFVFTFITWLSVFGLKNKNKIPRWSLKILLVIGILGLIVDGIIVYVNFIR